MIGMCTADSGRSPKAVAPFGGREARLGTNPISIAIPSDLEAPLYLDMATSAAAAGKIALAVARNEPVPDGWVIGNDGRPTNDPRQLRQGGALLPLGGPEGGYKGTGLAVMVEILCGLLTGLGFGVEPTGRHNDGCFMAVFNVAAFRPLAEFKKDVGEFIAYLKSTPPAEGASGVLYPGEIEHTPPAGPQPQRHRGRGRDLVQTAAARRRLRPYRQARIHRARMTAPDDRITIYGSFTSSSSYKPILYLALARLPYSFRTVNLKTGVQKTPRIPRGQPLGRRPVLAPSRADDPAVERDPRLSRAHHRPFRARDRAAALAGARMAVVGGRPHHRGRQGASFGPVPRLAPRGHRRVPPESRGGSCPLSTIG